jgi:hypothetical protein
VVEYLYDVSNHQENTPSLNGWAGLIAKASEGDWFRDGRFAQHRANTLSAGKAFGAYHFLRSDANIAAQVDTFLSVVYPSDPVIPDVEWVKVNDRIVSAPTLAQTREFIARLRDRGRYIPMIYLPRWYWQYWGSPDISDFPPLWLSRYPDYTIRQRDVAYAMVGPQPGFGGARAVMTQFTSSPLDQNAFEGTYEQLVALFGGQENEDDMGNWDTPITLTADERGDGGPTVVWTPDVYLKYANLYAGRAVDTAQAIQRQQAVDSAKLASVVTALAVGEGIDEDRLNDTVNTAVRETTRAALNGTIMPALRDVLGGLLNEDNAALSAETARRVLDGMASRLGPKPVTG